MLFSGGAVLQAGKVSSAEFVRQQGFILGLRELNERFLYNTGLNKKALVQTFGCQQNVSDSEKIQGMLLEMGYDFTENTQEADLVIFNTCAVREHAEQRAFGNVGALKPIKALKPEMIVGMCGCMMQQEHIVKKIKASYPHVDLVFGTNVLHRLPELLFSAICGHKRVFDTEQGEGVIAEGLPLRREGGVKAWLPISYGCNNFCSYCIVPYVRGRERSRLPEDVISEARELINEGYKDITLLGQNVNSYGTDLKGDYNFSRLLREINVLKGEFRIRFMTSHPKDATQELFDTIACCDKLSKHIHLPFQAGSDRVLKEMCRRYTKAQYLELINRAKSTIKGVSLTSDIIVGFPGETYEDFLQTLDVVKTVEFDNLYTFIFSKRVGTPAESMADNIPREEKLKWFNELLNLQNEISQKCLMNYVGTTVRVLCEGPGKTGGGYMTGRIDSGIMVDFTAPSKLLGQFVNVKVTQAMRFMLIGQAEC